MIKAVENLEINGIIMHRDIKPSNFLYDMNKKIGILIEYELSELILNIMVNLLKTMKMKI
jgi:serine/threonine protein kinase